MQATPVGGLTPCTYCGSNLLRGRDALRLGSVRLPALPAAASAATPAPIRRLRKQDEAVYVLPSFASRHSAGAMAIALLFLAPFAAAPLVGVVLIWAEPGLLAATKALISLFRIALALAMSAALALAFGSVHTVSVNRFAVAHELRLLGFRVRSETLPIVRLIEVECGLDDTALRVNLRLRSPTRKIEVNTTQKHPDGARFLRAVIGALEPVLRATGRLEADAVAGADAARGQIGRC